MAGTDRPRRLIVNADDFGRSPEVNEAVILAHREGILTSASLMVGAPAAAQAVELARAQPGLAVGLHLVLAGGRASASPALVTGLCAARGDFRRGPIRAGFAYFFRRALASELQVELAAQVRAFAETGLACDHINGHLNLHLHPTVLRRLLPLAAELRCRGFRLTRDRFWLNARLSGGRWAARIGHAVAFTMLCAWARPQLRRAGFACAGNVFGLLQSGRVTEDFLLALLPRLPEGDSEIYLHPDLGAARFELDALISPRVRAAVRKAGIQLVRYRELAAAG